MRRVAADNAFWKAGGQITPLDRSTDRWFPLRKGRFFVAVGLRHILLNKRSDDDVMDAAILDFDAVFDHLRHGFRPQVAGVCRCPGIRIHTAGIDIANTDIVRAAWP